MVGVPSGEEAEPDIEHLLADLLMIQEELQAPAKVRSDSVEPTQNEGAPNPLESFRRKRISKPSQSEA